MAALSESVDVWDSKDPERLRAVLTQDLVVEDRRRTGTGRLEGREAYVQSVAALWKLAPDSRFEAGRFWLAITPYGGVYAARRVGTLPGGGEFESDFLIVSLLKGGRTARLELFEIDAVDGALARFEELRPDP
jgi:ketosteroid isomerase-like protein